jgi:hypothetical protein
MVGKQMVDLFILWCFQIFLIAFAKEECVNSRELGCVCDDIKSCMSNGLCTYENKYPIIMFNLTNTVFL